MANDNTFLAGLGSGLSSAGDTLRELMGYKVRSQLEEELLTKRLNLQEASQSRLAQKESELRMSEFKQKLPLEEAAKTREKIAGEKAEKQKYIIPGKYLTKKIRGLLQIGENDTVDVRAIPSSINLEAKQEQQQKQKTLSSAQQTAITDTEKTINELKDIVDYVETQKVKTGPFSYKYSNLPLAQQYRATFGGTEDATFFSTLRQLQADFLKRATGAQRGFKEVSFLLPAIPNAELKPDQFIAVGKKAIADMEKNKIGMINTAKKANYDVSQFEDNSLDVSSPESFTQPDKLKVGGEFNGQKILNIEKVE